jgi:hypothetical protein
LTLYQTIEYDRVLRDSELKKSQAKKALAAQLAQQVQEGHARREKERADDKAYADSIQRDAQRYREEKNAMLFQKHQENAMKLQDFKEQVCLPTDPPVLTIALRSTLFEQGIINKGNLQHLK